MKELKTNDTLEYPKRIYASQLVTTDDLQELRKSIVADLISALKPSLQPPLKKWLNSHEVRRLLKISPGTLQTLKNNGIITFSKIGGVHFYDADEIQKLLESGKHTH
ncbi:helix-turn-helix domain-containing protein [Pinibacter soli]|uniref:Helix-turn-helix domain-containing protein n=1 Tax=Pinibacter soli TaxID=3044211 RepID=A0ABT6RHI6_9BACT|nr:helix-turn-helix domain-containing protein [Pinibacter soli]MDI3321314.1 helix-turn-helix domain-containing protein [Pinibacter soli]